MHADAHSYNAPEFLNKEETDIHFRQLTHKILQEGSWIQLCLASHNFYDHSFAEVLRKNVFPQAPKIEHQCLHMTYEALSTALSKMNWPTRNYVPVGVFCGNGLPCSPYYGKFIAGWCTYYYEKSPNKAPVLSPMDIHAEKRRKGELSEIVLNKFLLINSSPSLQCTSTMKHLA